MNKMIKMLVLVAVGTVAGLVQAQSPVAAQTTTIGNDSTLAQVLVKPPSYKITYANTKEIVTNDWMVFVWVERGKEFEGLDQYGNAVNPKTSIVLEHFPVKDGTFRPFTVAWPEDRWEGRVGDVRLLLLDTRLFKADEEQRAQSGTNKSWLANQGLAIQAYGTAGYYSLSGAGTDTTVTNEAGQATAPWADIPDYKPTDLAADTPVPVMVSQKVSTTNTMVTISSSYFYDDRRRVYFPYNTIKVTNTVENINYVVEVSTNIDFSTILYTSAPQEGQTGATLTFVVDLPAYYSSRRSYYYYNPGTMEGYTTGQTYKKDGVAYFCRVARYNQSKADTAYTDPWKVEDSSSSSGGR